MSTEYLWLEERVRITDRVPRERTEWGSWPGRCFIHKSDVQEMVKEFLNDMLGSIFPTEEKLISRLEDILCCCGSRPTQKTLLARTYGYTAGTNLPQYAHEDRQSYLIDYFQNMCNELSSNYEDAANADASVDFGVKIVKFLDETLGSHRSRIYNPGVVRLLHIIKQYIEKPHIQYIELPLVDFIRLIEGPQWEECAEKLKTTFSSNIFVSLKNEVIDAGRIGLYIEGPSVYELSSIKTHLTTYIDKTVNPPKDEQKKETGDEKSKTSGEKEADVENCEKKTATDKSDENITDVKEDVERSQATDSEKSEKTAISSTSDAESVSKEDTESSGNEKKRNSRSVDRYLQADEPVNKDVRDAFMRSKSVPATMEIHESHTQKPKRAKYDSECSNENISRPNPMQELTLFKESLSLVLAKRLEDNANTIVHV